MFSLFCWAFEMFSSSKVSILTEGPHLLQVVLKRIQETIIGSGESLSVVDYGFLQRWSHIMVRMAFR